MEKAFRETSLSRSNSHRESLFPMHFCPYPLPRFPFPLEPWGKPCFRSNLLGYVVDLSVELVFLEKDGIGRIMRSVHLRSVHTYFLKFSSLLYGVVRRCFEVQQNGDYCYYPTNGSLALGVVGIRSIFFVVGSARWIQCAIVVSVVVLLVDSWQKRKKIHSIN